MIDLHFHCLPGVDDGPLDLAEATAMCRAAAAAGCTAVVATPHQRCSQWWNSEPELLRSLHRRLQEAVGETLRIDLGAEIRVGAELLEDLHAPEQSGVLSLASSRYLLLELPRQGPWLDSEDLAHELRLDGWSPIFAHPEFAPPLASDIGLMERMVEAGSLFQVTAMSLTGQFGQQIRRSVHRMMDAGVVHFVASDAHDTHRRPPGLESARREIARRWNEETAWELTTGNPSSVIDNKAITTPRFV